MIPILPVPKNISIRTLSLCGFTYFIDFAQLYMVLKIDYFLADGKTCNLFREHFKPSSLFGTLCQCSSAWLEHSPCKRKVASPTLAIGSFRSFFHQKSLLIFNKGLLDVKWSSDLSEIMTDRQ